MVFAGKQGACRYKPFAGGSCLEVTLEHGPGADQRREQQRDTDCARTSRRSNIVELYARKFHNAHSAMSKAPSSPEG